MLYGNKAVEGSNKNNLQDAKGTYIIQELRRLALGGGGYLDYYFPRLGETNPLPQRGYSKLFEPYGWVIGTGLYVDDIEAVIAQRIEEVQKKRKNLVWQVVVFALFVVVVVVVIRRLIHAQISVPLTNMAKEAEKIGVGDFAIHIDSRWEDSEGRLRSSLMLLKSFMSMEARERKR